METLAEDLVLLAIDPYDGRVRRRGELSLGLMAGELGALAEAGRIDASSRRIVLTGQADLTTGDPDLDAALARLAAASRPPWLINWVFTPRPGIVDSYLARLAATGVVSRQGGARLARWLIVDGSRLSAVRARLDAVALDSRQGNTAQLDSAQLALAGLVDATRLSRDLYPGRGNRAVRRHLGQIAGTQWTANAVSQAIASAVAMAAS